MSFHGHRSVSQGHEQGTDDHRHAVSDLLVRHVSPDQRGEIDQGRVGAEQCHGVLPGPGPAFIHQGGREEHHEQGTHPVIGETFPHFREEQDEQPGRMP